MGDVCASNRQDRTLAQRQRNLLHRSPIGLGLSNCRTLVTGTTIELEWTVDFDNEQVQYRVRLSGHPVAWFLIGFSDHGKYAGSDFCKFDGTSMMDGYVTDSLRMESELQQDCVFYGRYADGSLRFSKKFQTCDMRDYAVETGTTQFVIATGLGDEKYLSQSTVSKEITFAQLLNEERDEYGQTEDEDTSRISITAQEALVPDQVTTYWCAVARLDDIFTIRKHHITKFEANVTKGNEHLVHHMEIYQCTHPGHDMEWLYNGDCNSDRKPDEIRHCAKVMAAWSFGAGALIYPPEAGMPLGGEDFYPYVMVEIHYNNVAKSRGAIDNSGFTISYTEELRAHDAGIMELGVIYSDANSIPPAQSAFPITGHCVAGCTQYFPPEGINIFATQLHAHLTGRKLWTSQYRNGVKVGEINRENHYSPHWQHINQVRPPINVQPGDVLSTTCVYETVNKNEFTLGGYGIDDEMCVNYVHYYPTSRVEVCKSAVDNTTLRNFFRLMGVNPLMPIDEMYKSVEWTPQRYSYLQELFNGGYLNMHCLRHDGEPFPNHPSDWKHVPQPKIRAGPMDVTRAQFECPAIND